MFDNKKKELSFDTLISETCTVDGNIKMEGTIKIDGRVNGEIKVEGDVILGEKAEVNGDVSGYEITISGSLKGNVTASGQLTLGSTARLFGDIRVATLITTEGAIFQGNCVMTNNTAQE